MKSWLEMLPVFEGRSLWMYGDTVGIPSVGIGHALFTPEDAVTVFGDARARKDWEAVKNAPAGHSASFYEGLTVCRLTDSEIEELLERDTAEALRKLQFIAPDSVDWTENVKFAAADIVYNTSSLRFPSMLAAIRSGDWETAAKESHRAGIQDSRNDWTRDMILSAISPMDL
jgi:GH24 family phage-related lysozyme (muramidase)